MSINLLWLWAREMIHRGGPLFSSFIYKTNSACDVQVDKFY